MKNDKYVVPSWIFQQPRDTFFSRIIDAFHILRKTKFCGNCKHFVCERCEECDQLGLYSLFELRSELETFRGTWNEVMHTLSPKQNHGIHISK